MNGSVYFRGGGTRPPPREVDGFGRTEQGGRKVKEGLDGNGDDGQNATLKDCIQQWVLSLFLYSFDSTANRRGIQFHISLIRMHHGARRSHDIDLSAATYLSRIAGHWQSRLHLRPRTLRVFCGCYLCTLHTLSWEPSVRPSSTLLRRCSSRPSSSLSFTSLTAPLGVAATGYWLVYPLRVLF